MIRDIINLIIKYCDFLILKKFDKIIKLRHREKKLKYSKNRNNFRCTGCAGELIYHCSDKEMFHYVNFFDKEINKEEPMLCISNHPYNENYYVCEKCKYFYLCCPKCCDANNPEIILCQFLGFRGTFIEPKLDEDNQHGHFHLKYRIINKTVIKELIDKFPIMKGYFRNNILSFDVYDLVKHNLHYRIPVELGNILARINMKDCFYDVSDFDIEYFDIKNFEPTGLDDDKNHYWRCKNCSTKYEICNEYWPELSDLIDT